MTLEDEFKTLIFIIAKKSNYELDPYEVKILKSELKPLGWEFVNASLRDFYYAMRSSDRFPSIVEIKAKCARLVGISESESHDARHLAEILWRATAQFGDYDAKSAEKKVGPIAWKLVERDGGWKNFKEGLLVENKAIHLSQWTKSLETTVETTRLQQALPASGSGEIKTLTEKISDRLTPSLTKA